MSGLDWSKNANQANWLNMVKRFQEEFAPYQETNFYIHVIYLLFDSISQVCTVRSHWTNRNNKGPAHFCAEVAPNHILSGNTSLLRTLSNNFTGEWWWVHVFSPTLQPQPPPPVGAPFAKLQHIDQAITFRILGQWSERWRTWECERGLRSQRQGGETSKPYGESIRRTSLNSSLALAGIIMKLKTIDLMWSYL